jgi:transaldolase / glucose-6-phosphate isomerase
MPPKTNLLLKLKPLGQSIWLDSIRRGQIASGELAQMIKRDGISGETSNPNIFEKAIAGSHDYDDEIAAMVREGKSALEIYETLAIEDVRNACDVFRPVYNKTKGADGFVSIEVNPKLARNAEGTIEEAKRFFRAVNRPNVMIKIPGTKEGVSAVEECLYAGLNINITLLFSVQAYEQVAWAYVRALERRAAEGKPVKSIASVASFFVSRIDTLGDKLLADKLKATNDPALQAKLKTLCGKAAIANAKLAYQLFTKIFGDPRFAALRKKGARVQRPLWASTSTKNPDYSDTLYVDALIGPDTINTLPQETIDAFRDHGKPRATLGDDIEGAQKNLRELAEVGLSMDAITAQVLTEGVVKFDDALNTLLASIESKRAAIKRADAMRMVAAVTGLDAVMTDANKNKTVERIWKRDPFLWKSDPKDHVELADRMGWLTIASEMRKQADELSSFGEEIKRAGFRDVVLCGIGGSALCVEVLRVTFRSARGYPAVHVLDTIDPATIRALERRIDLRKTLFVIASKSGGTTETLTQFKYFWSRRPDGKNFIAITDPGSGLEKMAKENQFRRIFANSPEIGGRFSALSYFGLVPAALMGIDVAKLLDRAIEMQALCDPSRPNAEENAGAWLGIAFAELAKQGRDKITIVTSPRIDMFGVWAEQLIAESTGKEGKGLVPIDRESLANPTVYGSDRIFVYLKLEGTKNAIVEARLKALQQAGHPVIELLLRDVYDLGAEFFRWEFAIAAAGARMQINPFDQPNVQESKDNTKRVLGAMVEGKWLTERAVWENAKFAVYATGFNLKAQKLRDAFRELAKQAHAGDYLAVMAYASESDPNQFALQTMRLAARDALHVATTLGYAPHFLHSTGQLHKGGPNSILGLQIAVDSKVDVKIPGEKFSFAELQAAQSLGDWESLKSHGRRALRVQVKAGAEMAQVVREFQAALGPNRQKVRRKIVQRKR